MENQSVLLTGKERLFGKDELIVSKTNLKGHITYANRLFMQLADLDEKDVLGAPHNIIRHPDMPRCIFKMLWEKIEEKKEIFAYVLNRSANGDHYWVIAHVTPSFDEAGNVVGYHSNRRSPDKRIIHETILPLYKELLGIENAIQNRKEGMNNAYLKLQKILQEKGTSYDEFIFSL